MFGVCLYPGVSKDQVAIILEALRAVPVQISLMSETWDDVYFEEDGPNGALTPTDTYHNPPDVGVQGLIIPGCESCLDADYRKHPMGFIRAAVGNVNPLVAVGTGTILIAKAGGLENTSVAIDEHLLESVCICLIATCSYFDLQYFSCSNSNSESIGTNRG